MNARYQDLERLKQYFLENLVEDPVNGTSFDEDVLKTIEALQAKYTSESCATSSGGEG